MSWAELQAWINTPQVDHALTLIHSYAGTVGVVAFTVALCIRAWKESD